MARLKSGSTVGDATIVGYTSTVTGDENTPVYIKDGTIAKCARTLPDISYSNGVLTIKMTTSN